VVSVFASLDVCEIGKGKHKGGAGIEVLIDDRRVGELTKLQADRYLEPVQGLALPCLGPSGGPSLGARRHPFDRSWDSPRTWRR
jgi:hypothetical protein